MFYKMLQQAMISLQKSKKEQCFSISMDSHEGSFNWLGPVSRLLKGWYGNPEPHALNFFLVTCLSAML